MLFGSFIFKSQTNLNSYTSDCSLKSEFTHIDSTEYYFKKCGLEGLLNYQVFKAAFQGVNKYNPSKKILAICDFNLPSTSKRFYAIDLTQMKLICQSLVAHGRNSGENIAEYFSNTINSYKSSLGFYKINQKINSPKHGEALILVGLEKGKNDHALKREIIMHAADYVSDDFIQKNGRLGRSHGCPALPSPVLKDLIPVIKDGALLYIHKDPQNYNQFTTN